MFPQEPVHPSFPIEESNPSLIVISLDSTALISVIDCVTMCSPDREFRLHVTNNKVPAASCVLNVVYVNTGPGRWANDVIAVEPRRPVFFASPPASSDFTVRPCSYQIIYCKCFSIDVDANEIRRIGPPSREADTVANVTERNSVTPEILRAASEECEILKIQMQYCITKIQSAMLPINPRKSYTPLLHFSRFRICLASFHSDRTIANRTNLGLSTRSRKNVPSQVIRKRPKDQPRFIALRTFQRAIGKSNITKCRKTLLNVCIKVERRRLR